MTLNRRDFLRHSAAAAGAGFLGAAGPAALAAQRRSGGPGADPLFDISLAQWSLHRTLQAGRMDNLDFAAAARNRFGVGAVEYVNQFFKDKGRDQAYLRQMKQRAEDAGVRSVLIMVDGEGMLGHPDAAERQKAVENHHQWVEAVKFLGGHSIRVNAASRGTYQEQQRLAADGLRRLAEFADGHGINVIVENHGGLSSNGAWLAETIRMADHPRAGTLPDFGNFRISQTEQYDRYRGVQELMPFAKGVSAKSHDFAENGDEVHTDYRRMLRIVLDAGYRGYIGIEYEGSRLPEEEGILATRRLLEKVRTELTPHYA